MQFSIKGKKLLALREKSGHYSYSCPELKKAEKAEAVYHIAGLQDLEEAFGPYVSRGLINGKEMTILRDSGSNLDLVSAHDVTEDQFTSEKVWVKQALDNKLRCLPIVHVEIKLSTGDTIRTKAAAVDKETNMVHYLLGNKTQQLIDRQKLNPRSINAVLTRQNTHRGKASTKTKLNRRARPFPLPRGNSKTPAPR